jgi:predicted permease
MTLDFMTLFHAVLSILVPVLLGYAVIKLKILSQDASRTLSTIVLKVTNPFLLLTSVIGLEYSSENLRSGLLVLLLALLVHAMAAAVGFLSTCRLKDQKARRVCEAGMIFANCGFFGIPLMRSLYGDVGVFWCGFYCIVFNVLLWSYGVFVLSRANRELKIRLTKILVNGGTVPCAVGLLIYVLRIPVYAPILDSMKTIGAAATPLSMIFVGTMLARVAPKKLVTTPLTYYTLFFKMLVMPVLAGVMLRLLGFSYDLSVFGALMAALPTGAATSMFAENYDIAPELAAQNVGVTTVLSLLTVPPIMQVVGFLLPYLR